MDIKSRIEKIISNNIEIGETENSLDYIVHNTSELAEEIIKLFDIPDVSNQRELLCTFFKFFRDNGEANIGMTIEQFVDAFLSTQ